MTLKKGKNIKKKKWNFYIINDFFFYVGLKIKIIKEKNRSVLLIFVLE